MKSCMDFRKVLARIFFLENVADLMKIDQSTLTADAETALLDDTNAKKQGLHQPLQP